MKNIALLTALLLTLPAAATADEGDPTLPSAQACSASEDCPSGYACVGGLCLPADHVEEEVEGCSAHEDCGPPMLCVRSTCPACTCPPCPAGEECGECECRPCTPKGVCAPPVLPFDRFFGDTCEADEECPSGFACKGKRDEPPCAAAGCGCDCAPCPDGEDCPDCDCPPCEPVECEEKTERRCVFEPLDCGGDPSVCAERFTCTSFGICAPGGGGGCVCPPCSCETCPAGEDCEPCDCPPCDCPAPEERSGLECWRAAELCIPEEIKCEANGDCPAGWVCAEPESEGRCIPEDWERLAKHAPEGGESQPTGGNEGGPTDNEGEGTPPAPTPGTPGAPVAGDPDGATGGSEAAPSGDAGGTGRLPTQGGSSGVGCATLPGPAGGSFALALLALLVVGVMRRRED